MFENMEQGGSASDVAGGLCSAGEDKAQAEAIGDLMDHDDLDLVEAVERAEQNYKASLARRLKAVAGRKGYEAPLAELALSLDDAALAQCRDGPDA